MSTTYFYAEHEFLDRSIIDDSYNNYVLSRKEYVKNLPVVTVSESAGYVTKGYVQMRHVETQGDEFFVAVGRDYNKRMVHYVFDCFKAYNGYMRVEHFICASQYINAWWTSDYSPENWIRSDRTEATGLLPYEVPDDLCAYIFARTPRPTNERAGFQIFSSSGSVLYDSRHKYMDIICLNDSKTEEDNRLIQTKKIAIGSTNSALGQGHHSSGSTTNYYYTNNGGVVFEKGYTCPTGRSVSDIVVGAGARILNTDPSYSSAYDFGFGSGCFVLDVTGF